MKRTVVALCLAALVSCGKGPASGGPSGGGTERVLVYARGGDSEKLDPQDTTSGESVKVTTQLFDTLVDFAEDSARIVPALATKWTTSADGRTWTFDLREGVKFHDGTPCDADAVVFSMKRIIDPKDPNRNGGGFEYTPMFNGVEEVKADGPGRVVFRLKTPSAVFLANLAGFWSGVVSPTAVKKTGADFARNPVGTGPFRFVKWVPNDKIVLAANLEYWGGRPKVDKVIFSVKPDNSSRLLALKSGDAHIMDGVNCADLDEIKRDPALVVLERSGMNFGYLAMNTSKAPFDDKRVRRAVAMAVDKKKIVEMTTFGHGQPAVNPLPPTVWGYDAEVRDWPRDVTAARKLLAEAGHPDGIEVTLYAMTSPRPYFPEPKKVVAILQQDLAEAGIRVKTVENELNAHFEATKRGEHQMCIMGWITDNGDPDNFLYTLLASENATVGVAQNISFFRNPAFDGLVKRAQGEIDAAERAKLYAKAQEIVHEECPVVPLVYMNESCAMRKDVTGYELHPMGLIRLRNVGLK